MKATYNSEGLPHCPDCGYAMFHESAGDRDTETMGGFSVDYFVCERDKNGVGGCGQFEIIDGHVSQSFS